MRPNAWIAVGLALAASLFATSWRATAMPGAARMDEHAIFLAVTTNETLVIETRAPKGLPCEGRTACEVSEDVVRSFTQANQRRGYIECKRLPLPTERCVRWRQVGRTLFRGFPVAVFSRPGISADARTAVVHLTFHASVRHGYRAWVFLARDDAGMAWKIIRRRQIASF